MNADDHAQIGARLKAARQRAGYRNRQAASEALERFGLHWTPSTVEKAEMGQRRVLLSEVPALTVAYGVTAETLTSRMQTLSTTAGTTVLRAAAYDQDIQAHRTAPVAMLAADGYWYGAWSAPGHPDEYEGYAPHVLTAWTLPNPTEVTP